MYKKTNLLSANDWHGGTYPSEVFDFDVESISVVIPVLVKKRSVDLLDSNPALNISAASDKQFAKSSGGDFVQSKLLVQFFLAFISVDFALEERTS